MNSRDPRPALPLLVASILALTVPAVGQVTTVSGASLVPLETPEHAGRAVLQRPDGELLGFSTIQQAVDLALNGDTILLQPGLYQGPGNRDVFVSGKAVEILGVGSVVIDCEGAGRGFHFDGPTTVGETRLERVQIRNGSAGAVGGGAILVTTSAAPRIKSCSFVDNQTTGCGGAIFVAQGDLLVGASRFYGNSAQSGGAICATFASGGVVGSHFEGNTATVVGGAIAVTGASQGSEDLDFVNNSIVDNVAGFQGGGIYSEFVLDGLFERLTIARNSANQGGGAYVFGQIVSPNPLDNLVFFKDCMVTDNEATTFGGGIATSFVVIVSQNSTVAGNTANVGGGLYGELSAGVFMISSLAWGNQSSEPDVTQQQVRVPASPTAYTILDRNIQGTDFGSLDQDPLFVAPELGNYHLGPASPCIDAGFVDYVVEPGQADIDGQDRVSGDRIDIGADEVQQAPFVPFFHGG